jgi:ribosomal protein S6
MVEENKEVGNKEIALADELQVYELGFHILPMVAEEKLEQEVTNIKALIEKNGGFFIGEESFPKMMDLAYSMEKAIDNKKSDFNTAYFGWVKFETNPTSIEKIKENLDLNESILRFLLIKSVRESKMISRKPTVLARPYPEKPVVKDVKKEPEELISEAQVDKAIDELVAD